MGVGGRGQSCLTSQQSLSSYRGVMDFPQAGLPVGGRYQDWTDASGSKIISPCLLILTWAFHEQLTFGIFQILFMPWQQNKTRQNKKANPRMKRVALSSCPRHDRDSEDTLKNLTFISYPADTRTPAPPCGTLVTGTLPQCPQGRGC